MRVHRATVLDSLRRDDEVTVFVDGRVLLLSPLASRMWSDIGDQGVDLEVLTSTLTAHFGAPPSGSPEAMVRAIVIDLAEAGVLRTEGV